MAQYCSRTVVIPGTDAFPSVPVFLCLKAGVKSWCHNTGILISDPLAIERFLNSLSIGDFSVTGNGVDGITIITDCNNIEFDTATFNAPGALTSNFDEENCSDSPCEPCEYECLEGLIGVRELCEPKTSKNCVWLDDIGISRFTLEQLLTRNYASPTDFFNKQYTHTLNEVAQNIHNNFADKYIARSILEGQRLGYPQNGMTVKATNSKKAGIWVEMLNSNSFLDLYVSELQLWTDFTGTIPVKVYDEYEGRVIDTINVDSIAGRLSTAFVNKSYKSKRNNLELFFGYDSTGINSYKTLIKNNLCCGKTACSNQYITAGGGYSDANIFLESDIKASDHTHGMSLTYSLQCNHKDWLCNHRNMIALPLAYKLAANLTTHGILATKDERTNNKVTINGAALPDAMNYYEQKWTESIASVLMKMHTPSDAKCFQCRTHGGTFFSPA